MSPPNGCCSWAACCVAMPGSAVICALAGDWTIVASAVAVGAAEIATAAAPAANSGAMWVSLIRMMLLRWMDPIWTDSKSGLIPDWFLGGLSRHVR